MSYAYQVVQIVYWLILATWLGSMVFLAAAAPVVFRTARELDVRVPRYSSANLIDQQGTIVGGAIVGSLLGRLAQIQIICDIAMLPLLLAQCFVADFSGPQQTATLLRLALWLMASGLLFYEWRWHYPRAWQLRETYLQHADEPEIANVAKEQFDHEHHRSEVIYQAGVFVLIGMVMFSANIMPRGKSERGRSGGEVRTVLPE